MDEYSPITAAELPQVVELLNAEYMVQRNRIGTVTERYPDLFDIQNSSNLLVLRDNKAILSFCAVQEATVHFKARVYRGGMIGFVYTCPAKRGRGYAKMLLQRAEETIRLQGLDFAVLFSTLHEFYTKQGWVLHDEGLLGIWKGPSPTAMESEIGMDVNPDAILNIEHIRREREALWVERTVASYQRRPLSVDHLRVMFSSSKKAYCLYGVKNSHIYIYELAGEPSGLDEMWSRLTKFYAEITVNFHENNSAREWLMETGRLQVNHQRHALWKWIKNHGVKANNTLCHLPYFDRI